MEEIKWKILGKNQVEGSRGKYDFHIRKEKIAFILDIFNSRIKDADDAFISSEDYPSMEEAKIAAEKFKE